MKKLDSLSFEAFPSRRVSRPQPSHRPPGRRDKGRRRIRVFPVDNTKNAVL